MSIQDLIKSQTANRSTQPENRSEPHFELGMSSIIRAEQTQKAVYAELLNPLNCASQFKALAEATGREILSIIKSTNLPLEQQSKAKSQFTSATNASRQQLTNLIELAEKAELAAQGGQNKLELINLRDQAETSWESLKKHKMLLERAMLQLAHEYGLNPKLFRLSALEQLEQVANQHYQRTKSLFDRNCAAILEKIDDFKNLYSFLECQKVLVGNNHTYPAQLLIDLIKDYRASGDRKLLASITRTAGLRKKVENLYLAEHRHNFEDTVIL